jgi:pimeloyl-ACP methyl ester carboxylesterase
MRWYANVREVGGGDTTVVLAHGYGSNQALWDKLVPTLSRRNRVILFDWGFTGGGGGAEHQEAEEGRYTFGKFADDLIALLDDKGVRGAVLVGHSMSAMAACIASVRRPDLVTHLVLLCASPRSANIHITPGSCAYACACIVCIHHITHHALPLAVATNLLRRRPTATAQSFYF